MSSTSSSPASSRHRRGLSRYGVVRLRHRHHLGRTRRPRNHTLPLTVGATRANAALAAMQPMSHPASAQVARGLCRLVDHATSRRRLRRERASHGGLRRAHRRPAKAGTQPAHPPARARSLQPLAPCSRGPTPPVRQLPARPSSRWQVAALSSSPPPCCTWRAPLWRRSPRPSACSPRAAACWAWRWAPHRRRSRSTSQRSPPPRRMRLVPNSTPVGSGTFGAAGTAARQSACG